MLDHGKAVQTGAGVDVLRRQRRDYAVGALVELHEDEVPIFKEAIVLAAGEIVRRPVLLSAVEVELAARAAGSGWPCLPEVLRARAEDDPLARNSYRLPGSNCFFIRAEAELLVALEDGDPDLFGVKTESLQRKLPGQLDRTLFEVNTKREVAEHLKESEVTGGVANVLNVGRAKALLATREPRRRRLLQTHEVLLQGVHPGRRQQHRRVKRGWHERAGWPQRVAIGLEELEEGGAKLIGAASRHQAIVAHPTTRSPLSSTAV